MGDIIKLDEQYSQWIKDISVRFKQSQIKAACKVNQELLKFYWELGREISIKEKENTYGSGLYKRLSADLRKEIPDVKSFSVTNLHYMKWFYELYSNAEILPQLVEKSDKQQNLPQVGVNFEQLIFSIPWGHNKLIIDKCKGNKDKGELFPDFSYTFVLIKPFPRINTIANIDIFFYRIKFRRNKSDQTKQP